MFDLIGDNPVRFLIALAIGVATAWWIWARRADESAAARADDDKAEPAPHAPAAAEEPEIAAAEGPRIAAAVGADDDLTKINGIGPALRDLCNSLGVRRFDQVAAWGDAEVADVDSYLGSFKGRILRDNWVEQAKLLAAGNEAEWQARFGYKSAKP